MTRHDETVELIRSANPVPAPGAIAESELAAIRSVLDERKSIMRTYVRAPSAPPEPSPPRRRPALAFAAALLIVLTTIGGVAWIVRDGNQDAVTPNDQTPSTSTTVSTTTIPATTTEATPTTVPSTTTTIAVSAEGLPLQDVVSPTGWIRLAHAPAFDSAEMVRVIPLNDRLVVLGISSDLGLTSWVRDPAGDWTRNRIPSGSPLEGAELTRSSVVATAGRILLGHAGRVIASTDGVTWTSVYSSGVIGPLGEGVTTLVSAGESGVTVVTGVGSPGGEGCPADASACRQWQVASSEDLVTWHTDRLVVDRLGAAALVPDLSSIGAFQLFGIAPFESGFVGGGVVCDPSLETCRGGFFSSDDGVAWSMRQAVRLEEVISMETTSEGIVAATRLGGTFEIYLSRDGIAWERVHEEVLNRNGEGAMVRLTASGDGLAAAGWVSLKDSYGGFQPPQAALWLSDDGTVWSNVPVDDPILGFGTMSDLAPTDTGFVAVGEQCTSVVSGVLPPVNVPEECAGAVWVYDSGR